MAGRAVPVELARLESALVAAVQREAARVLVHQVADQLEVAAPLERAPPAAAPRAACPVPAASGCARSSSRTSSLAARRALALQDGLEHDVEQIERRVAREVAAQQLQALRRSGRAADRQPAASRRPAADRPDSAPRSASRPRSPPPGCPRTSARSPSRMLARTHLRLTLSALSRYAARRLGTPVRPSRTAPARSRSGRSRAALEWPATLSSLRDASIAFCQSFSCS